MYKNLEIHRGYPFFGGWDSYSLGAEGWTDLGDEFFYGDETEPDYDKAVEFYRNALMLYAQRHYELDTAQEKGDWKTIDLFNEKIGEIIEKFERLVQLEHIPAIYEMAKLYENNRFYDYGIGIRPDINKTIELLESAGKKGMYKAYEYIAKIYMDGKEGVLSNSEKGIKYYKKAAELGSEYAAKAVADYYVQCNYYEGEDEKNDLESAKWNLYAAELGSVQGMLCTATNYQYGVGVEVDDEKAFYWYEKAYETNSSMGSYYLAECYFWGVGVEKDYRKAFELYEKTQCFNLEALKRVADCCKFGLGTEKDIRKANEMMKLYREEVKYANSRMLF